MQRNPKLRGLGLMAVRGVVLDEAIVFDSENVGRFCDGSDKLLLRICYSDLFLGILTRSGLSPVQVSALNELGMANAVNTFILGTHPDVITSQWGIPGESCLLVGIQTNAEDYKDFKDSSWIMETMERSKNDHIPFLITKLNKKGLGTLLTVVGHCMRWSREKDFLKRGATPLLSTTAGLAFLPIDLSSSLEEQLSLIDILLTKATDEIVSVSKTTSDTDFQGIKFSEGFNKLESYLVEHPEICVVDPRDRVVPLMDRVATQELLQSLPTIHTVSGAIVRSPRCLKVLSFNEPDLLDRLKPANLHLPTIVKPQIACGASESHTMAVVFEEHGYTNLPVPLPAVIQEYVNHRSIIYKFYVLGDEVFYSTRNSTPDAAVLREMMKTDQPAIVFDSLKSLPTAAAIHDGAELDISAMKSTAAALREKLGLTIIGFDVVVQTGTQDHVIVDVNYFPTFKDVPDSEAISAFWKALRSSKTRTSKMRQ